MDESLTAGGHAPPARWGWAVLAALLALELAALVTYARREIVWAYPGFYDQCAYLTQTYDIVANAQKRGLWPAVRAHLARDNASGVLLPVQGALHSVVFGSDRLGVLTANFALLALFQGALAGTLVWLTRSWWAALGGVGLTLAAQTPFHWAGGAFDFRMDFAAQCLYGTFLCALVRSRVLLNPRGALAVGACAAALVLFRFITVVYLGALFAALGAGLLVWRFTRADADAKARAGRRLVGCVLAVAVLGAVAGPVLWKQRKHIKAYYVVGHVTSSEKDIRRAESGLRERLDAVLFYPRAVRTHTGPAFWWAAGLLGLSGAAGALGFARRGGGRALVLPVAALGFLAPFAVLNVGEVKSPVVAGVLVPALIWSALAPLVVAARRAPGWAVGPPCAAALVLGAGAFLAQAATPGPYSGTDAREAVRLLNDLSEARTRKGFRAPELFCDANTHDIHGGGGQILEFERTGRWEPCGDGTAIFADDEANHMLRLARCDLVILKGVPAGQFKFPYDEQMERMRPRLWAYCEANLQKVGEYRIQGRTVTTYVRPFLRVEGLTADGWVTADGVSLVGTADDLRGCRRVELVRVTQPNYLGNDVRAEAVLELPGRPPVPLAVAVADDLRAVSIECPLLDVPGDTPVTIRLRFGAWFRPCDRGITPDDPRQLVMFVGVNPRAVLHRADWPNPK